MICLITTTEREALYLLTRVHILETMEEGMITLMVCDYKGIKFLLLLTGYGKLNVGLGIGYAMHAFKITTFIGFGNCASLRIKDHEIGSIVILTASLQYDVSFQALGYPEAVVPGMDRGVYIANQNLVKEAQKACGELGYLYGLGTIASSDKFIADDTMRERIRRCFDCQFLDHECGPIGQAATVFQIPHVLVKGISNYADEDGVNDYENCSKLANERASQVVYGLLERLLDRS